MKTLRITDQQVVNLTDILTKEFMAGYTRHKEKHNADEILMILYNAHWEPDPEVPATTHDLDESLFRYFPGWLEVEA
jgi:hypothetical protein